MGKVAKEGTSLLGGGGCVSLRWNYTDVKLLLSFLLFFFALATFIQFHPAVSGVSPSAVSSCFAKLMTSPLNPATGGTSAAATYHPLKKEEQITDGSVLKRALNPIGSAAYLFIQMGAYRGGLNTFAVVGLASKPVHVFAKPTFLCEWQPHDRGENGNSSVTTDGYAIRPDWDYGRVYTTVVVTCTFPRDVGADGSGGRLIVHATSGGGDDREKRAEERFVAVEEAPGSLNASVFSAPPKYDYLYCGSPLYGDLSPQRVREWVAYHVKLFGDNARIVLYDAGGVHEGVMEVLRPWMEKGVLTLQDIREQERFDGYYHNQFLVVNDCLHRYKFMAKWMFFFDLDEFLYLSPKTTLAGLLNEYSGYTQFTIEQMPIAINLCSVADYGKNRRMWGIEKLVYRDVKRGVWRDRKYAIQPRNVYATGVHMSVNLVGGNLDKTEGRIKYFHYQGSITGRREPCTEFLNTTEATYKGTPYVLDQTLRLVAGSVKRFELKSIGHRLVHTPQ